MNAKGLVFAILGTLAGYFASNAVEGGLNKAFNGEKAEKEDEMKEAFASLISGKEDEED